MSTHTSNEISLPGTNRKPYKLITSFTTNIPVSKAVHLKKREGGGGGGEEATLKF